eukprot:comp19598_c0_seq1/m.23073 comp19598_c0_seq1/g.23073  ORF comp19598_c0_seq1/g.23073 comp19598_c0_seq1/m.23073 type:complete len:126 (+) comp19598_c0_seq1:71-448(+)
MSLLPVLSKAAPLVASATFTRALASCTYATLSREHIRDTTKDTHMPFIGERLTLDHQHQLANRMRIYQSQAVQAEQVLEPVPHADPEGLFMTPFQPAECDGQGVWEGTAWEFQEYTPRVFDVFGI